jgi:hypothetical protein
MLGHVQCVGVGKAIRRNELICSGATHIICCIDNTQERLCQELLLWLLCLVVVCSELRDRDGRVNLGWVWKSIV